MEDNKLFKEYDETIAQMLTDITATAMKYNGMNVTGIDLNDEAHLFILELLNMSRTLYHIDVKFKCSPITFIKLRLMYKKEKLKLALFKKFEYDYNIEEQLDDSKRLHYSNIYNLYYRKEK